MDKTTTEAPVQAAESPAAAPKREVKAHPAAIANRRKEAATKTDKALAILERALHRRG